MLPFTGMIPFCFAIVLFFGGLKRRCFLRLTFLAFYIMMFAQLPCKINFAISFPQAGSDVRAVKGTKGP